MNQAELRRLVPALRIAIAPRHKNLKNPLGPEGRLTKLVKVVTALVKEERIELYYPKADEARGYAERLISEAIRYGDCHTPTMELADYWLNEKHLIHKLFKVLVPRYRDYNESYTRLVKAPRKMFGPDFGRSVLELKGNPFPAIKGNPIPTHNWLHNILIEEARREHNSLQTKLNEIE